MKRIKIAYVLMLLGLVANAQGIEFFHGSYEEALEKAQKENKKIFVDVYTTWCGPCKQMTKKTFTDPEVGKLYNEEFVALKLDAENEADSPFFDKYTATAFPTVFWLDSKGDILDQNVGYLDPAGLLSVTKKAVNNNIMAEYKKAEIEFEANPNFETYSTYVMGFVNKLNPEKVFPITEEFISGLSEDEIKTLDTYNILIMFTRKADDNVMFNTLLKNWGHYMDLLKASNPRSVTVGDEGWKKLYTCFVRQPSVARSKNETEDYNRIMEYLNNADFEFKDIFLDSNKFEAFAFDGKYSEAIDKMFELTEKYKEYPFLYNNYYYTMIYTGFFKEDTVKSEDADRMIEFARKNAKIKATQQSILYLAAAYARKNDYKTAYGYLANLNFYPRPLLSNALYKYLNLPVTKTEFPW